MNGIIAYILGKKYTDQKVSELPTPYKVKPAVNNYSDLPSSGNTAGDVRKVISEDGKEYYWDGTAWEVMGANTPKENTFRYTTMPEAAAGNVGNIVQYIGTTTADYTNGYYYQCQESEGTYSWVQKNVQAGGGGGTDLDLSIVGGKLCVSFEEV